MNLQGADHRVRQGVTYPVWPRLVAWCSGPRPRMSLWFTSAPFWSRNSHAIKEPWGRDRERKRERERERDTGRQRE